MLPRTVGTVRARAMAMLAEKIDAETAERWGLVYRVFDDAALMNEAMALADRLAALPTDGLAAMKRTLDAASANTFEAQLSAERDAQAEAGRHPDYAEGVAAFMDKRRPNYQGRL